MANEIKFNHSITYENGKLKFTYNPGAANIPQATQGYSSRTIAATTAEADLAWVVGTPKLCVLRILEATSTGNSLEWGIKTSTGGINNQAKMAPLQTNMTTIATSTCILRYKASAGTVNFQILEFNG
jgi:hypothetical protein